MIHQLSQLKNNPHLQADKQWLRISKAELLSEIAARQQIMQMDHLTLSQRLNLFSLRLTRRLVPSTLSLVALFVLFSFGFSTTFIAQAAVPGDILYPVKITIEKAELALATNPVSETEISLRHANNRLKELEVLASKDLNDDQRNVAISEVVRRLERNIVSADSSLKIAQSSASPENKDKTAVVARSLSRRASAAAKALEEKAKSLAGIIVVDGRVISKDTKIYDTITVDRSSGIDTSVEAKRGLEQPTVVKTLTEAIKVNEGISKSALNTAAELHTQTQSDEIATKDLSSLITDTITDQESQLQAESDVVDSLDISALRKELRANPIEGITILTLEALPKNVDKAKEILESSRKLLETGKLIEALDELNKGKIILEQNAETLAKVSDLDKTLESPVPTATSTESSTANTVNKGSSVKMEVIIPTSTTDEVDVPKS